MWDSVALCWLEFAKGGVGRGKTSAFHHQLPASPAGWAGGTIPADATCEYNLFDVFSPLLRGFLVLWFFLSPSWRRQ